MFSLEPYVVRGHSMSPTFSEGDRLLVSRFRGRSYSFVRGELVVVRDCPDGERRHLKRVIGLPRESVRQSEGVLLINDQPLDEDYLGGLPAVIGLEEVTWNLGGNEYFLLGDNRAHSTDSRRLGPFGLDDIEGKVRFRYWPLHKLRFFSAPAYRSLPFTKKVFGFRPED